MVGRTNSKTERGTHRSCRPTRLVSSKKTMTQKHLIRDIEDGIDLAERLLDSPCNRAVFVSPRWQFLRPIIAHLSKRYDVTRNLLGVWVVTESSYVFFPLTFIKRNPGPMSHLVHVVPDAFVNPFFICRSCEHRFEVTSPDEDKRHGQCPECGGFGRLNWKEE